MITFHTDVRSRSTVSSDYEVKTPSWFLTPVTSILRSAVFHQSKWALSEELCYDLSHFLRDSQLFLSSRRRFTSTAKLQGFIEMIEVIFYHGAVSYSDEIFGVTAVFYRFV